MGRTHSRVPLPPKEHETALPGDGGFPGVDVLSTSAPAPDRRGLDRFKFIMRSGRAFYTRSTRAPRAWRQHQERLSEHDQQYRDHMIMWAKDVGRSVDYLESRRDIAKDKIGFIGFSWGADVAPVCSRRRAADLARRHLVGGVQSAAVVARSGSRELRTTREGPGVDAQWPFRFLLPDGTSQEPMFRLLGTPAEHKRRVVYETSHVDPAERDDQGSGELDGQGPGVRRHRVISR